MSLLLSFAVQKGIFTTLREAADETPFLWAIYGVVMLMPLLLVAICVCPRSGDEMKVLVLNSPFSYEINSIMIIC